MLTLAGDSKPALSRYAIEARKVDARNPVVQVKPGLRRITVKLPVREFCVTNPPGTRLGATYKVRLGRLVVGVAQPELTLASDCTVMASFRVAVARKKTYVATFSINDTHGLQATRTVTITAR